MAEMGYFGILIPQKYGGLGLGAFEYCLVAEELARAWMSVASLIARGNGLFGMSDMSEQQRQTYLPRVARGEWLGAYALSEPNAGSDIANIACRAAACRRGWSITGNKYWCTFADGRRLHHGPGPQRYAGSCEETCRYFGLHVEKKRGKFPAASRVPDS